MGIVIVGEEAVENCVRVPYDFSENDPGSTGDKDTKKGDETESKRHEDDLRPHHVLGAASIPSSVCIVGGESSHVCGLDEQVFNEKLLYV